MRIAPGGPFFTDITEAQLIEIVARLKFFIENQDANRA